MKRLICTAFFALIAAVPAAEAACSYPPEVAIPDGKTATKDEMVAAQKAVKEYNTRVEEYLSCLDKEEQDLGDTVTDEQKALHVSRHNSAVDALTAVAARYNEAARAFNAKKPSP